MKIAKHVDKRCIIDILCNAFAENKSVNHLVGERPGKSKRVRLLMEYAFEQCMNFGKVYINDDRNSCALVLFPEQKGTTFKSSLRDLKLILSVIGVSNLSKVLKKESVISGVHQSTFAKSPLYYLWFIGVNPTDQGKGLGSKMLLKLLADSTNLQRNFILETSTLENLPFYTANGLSVYSEVEVGYKLYFLKY